MRQSFTQSADVDTAAGRGSPYTARSDRVRDAARQRAAATRRRETDEARATHTHSNVRVTTKAREKEGLG